jgi:ADP-heptose:LPS heptosyltransferase
MKILIIQLRAIGDVICTLPAIVALKQALPAAELHFLVEPSAKPIVESHPGISKVLVYDKSRARQEIARVRAEKYDAVFDFMNNPRTAYITGFSRAPWKVSYTCGVRSLFYNFVVPEPVEPEYVPKRKIRLVNAWLQKIDKKPVLQASYRPQLRLTAEDETFAADWAARENVNGKKDCGVVPNTQASHLLLETRSLSGGGARAIRRSGASRVRGVGTEGRRTRQTDFIGIG